MMHYNGVILVGPLQRVILGIRPHVSIERELRQRMSHALNAPPLLRRLYIISVFQPKS